MLKSKNMIIVGLGNPGAKYVGTRHNVGFDLVNKFVDKNHFPLLKGDNKHKVLTSDGIINGEKIILAQPLTFMNKSGLSVKSLTNFYKIEYSDLIVVHDDSDLPLGKIKISINRGSAGHRGIESIIREIGSKNFIRVRIGVRPTSEIRKAMNIVLQKFRKEEKPLIEKALKDAVKATELLISEGVEKTMNKYNQ